MNYLIALKPFSLKVQVKLHNVPNTKYPPELFKFIGSIFALAFYFDIPLEVEFLPAFYRILTGKNPIVVKEMAEVESEYLDPVLYNGLIALRETDLAPLKLDFMGAEVTSENLEAFIDHEIKNQIYFKYAEHLESLKRGFFSFINAKDFGSFRLRSEELKVIFRGDSFITAEDFIKNVNVTKLTDANSRKWIFELIEEFSDNERLLLFKFITARRSVPFRGLSKLLVPISFASVNVPEVQHHLPTASICGSLMKIPVYASKDILKEKLLM